MKKDVRIEGDGDFNLIWNGSKRHERKTRGKGNQRKNRNNRNNITVGTDPNIVRIDQCHGDQR